MAELLAFACPRCKTEVNEEFYGPCRACVGALRAEQGLNKTEMTTAAYEPKMNVTPNAVALKE